MSEIADDGGASSLSELFSRDPMSLSRQDLLQIVKRLREARAQFNLGDMKAGSDKPKAAKAGKGLGAQIDLSELGL